jgi:hypothetical protein
MRLARLLTLLAFALPTLAQLPPPSVGPELAVSAAERTSDTFTQYYPTIASDGEGFLALWEDGRAGGGLFVTRLNAAGEVLDPEGIAVAGASATADIQLAWDGRDYVAGWSDGLSFKVLRIGRNGLPIGHPTTVFEGYAPGSKVIATASSIVAIGGDPRSAITLDLDLNVTRNVPLGVAKSSTMFLTATTLATDGSDVLVAWITFVDFFPRVATAVVGSSGEMAQPPRLLERADSDRISALWSGTRYLLAWTDGITRNRPTPQGRAMFVNRDGTASGAAFDFAEASVQMVQHPAGGGLLIAPNRVYEVRGETISAPRTQQSLGRIALNNRGEAVGVLEERPGLLRWTVSATSFARPGARTPITRAATPQFGPVRSKNATNWVAWTQPDGEGWSQIFASDLASSAPPIQISKGSNSRSPSTLASDGKTVVVAWMEYSSLVTATFDADGGNLKVRAATTDVLSTNLYDTVGLAWTGLYYLMAWPNTAGDLVVAPLAPQGGLLTPPARVSSSKTMPQGGAVIVPGGESALLLWHEGASRNYCAFECATPPPGRVYAARVSAGGFVLDLPQQLSPEPAGLFGPVHFGPDAAWNGSTFLVSWCTAPDWNQPATAMLARVSVSGRMFDRIAVPGAGTPVASNGNFLINTGRGIVRVAASGPLTPGTPASRGGTLLRLSGGAPAVFYVRTAFEAGGSTRLFYRLLDLPIIPRQRPAR